MPIAAGGGMTHRELVMSGRRWCPHFVQRPDNVTRPPPTPAADGRRCGFEAAPLAPLRQVESGMKERRMPVRYQLVIDCADPDLLARFWAAALGYELAPVPAGFATWN